MFWISGNAQQGVTSGGFTVSNGNYSMTHTIGEVVQSFESADQFNTKNGIIQFYKKTDTAVKETEEIEVLLYPSPTTQKLQLRHQFNKPVVYKIFNMQGSIVLAGSLVNDEILLDGIPSSTYLLQLQMDDYIFSDLFIKL